eukprot:105624_1
MNPKEVITSCLKIGSYVLNVAFFALDGLLAFDGIITMITNNKANVVDIVSFVGFIFGMFAAIFGLVGTWFAEKMWIIIVSVVLYVLAAVGDVVGSCINEGYAEAW